MSMGFNENVYNMYICHMFCPGDVASLQNLQTLQGLAALAALATGAASNPADGKLSSFIACCTVIELTKSELYNAPMPDIET